MTRTKPNVREHARRMAEMHAFAAGGQPGQEADKAKLSVPQSVAQPGRTRTPPFRGCPVVRLTMPERQLELNSALSGGTQKSESISAHKTNGMGQRIGFHLALNLRDFSARCSLVVVARCEITATATNPPSAINSIVASPPLARLADLFGRGESSGSFPPVPPCGVRGAATFRPLQNSCEAFRHHER